MFLLLVHKQANFANYDRPTCTYGPTVMCHRPVSRKGRAESCQP